jgi:hypothetical protein
VLYQIAGDDKSINRRGCRTAREDADADRRKSKKNSTSERTRSTEQSASASRPPARRPRRRGSKGAGGGRRIEQPATAVQRRTSQMPVAAGAKAARASARAAPSRARLRRDPPARRPRRRGSKGAGGARQTHGGEIAGARSLLHREARKENPKRLPHKKRNGHPDKDKRKLDRTQFRQADPLCTKPDPTMVHGPVKTKILTQPMDVHRTAGNGD